MYNFCAKFRQILDICKRHSENLVNSLGNVPRVGVVPRFSDLEVIALSLTAEALGIDSENCLFHRLSLCKDGIPNLISRRQYNDRRKLTAGLCEEIRKRIADEIDGGEDCFIVDSKPIEVCKPARSKRCAMGRGDIGRAPSYGYCASQGKYYYGYKLHGLTGTSGVFHSYDITAANVHDINYLNDIKLEYHDCGIVGDKGYLSAEVQLDLFETANIRLETPSRSNQKDAKPFPIVLRRVRKRIETNFSQLCEQFLFIRNYAKNVDGLFTRIIGVRAAYTFSEEEIVYATRTQLTWTHLRTLMSVKDPLERQFYAQMCGIEHWDTRTLDEKIDQQLYQRTAISRKPEEVIRQELEAAKDENQLLPDMVFRSSYFLDMLGLPDIFTEKDLEAAIITQIEDFIRELGSDFTFVARQKRITVDATDYYLDLLFFHRELRRLVAIDLKLGKFKPEHEGQMLLYLRYLNQNERKGWEESPIGLILCSEGNTEHIEYLMLDDNSPIKVAQYYTQLPDKQVLAQKLKKAIAVASEHYIRSTNLSDV